MAADLHSESHRSDALPVCLGSDYSLIEHLAKIAGGSDWKRVRLAMFTAYFDASGDNSCRFVVAVCGFVASADAWITWETEWLERLRVSDLDALHMKELEKSKHQKLIADLCEITRNHVARKFGVVVVNREILSRLSKTDQETLHMNSYALAGRTAARMVKVWTDGWSGPFPEIVFEKGDAGQEDLRHLLISQGYPEPDFRPKKTYTDQRSGIVHKAAVPLQAADLFANLLFCNIRESALSNTNMARLPRGLDNIPGEPGEIEADRYALIKQGIEQSDTPLLVPGVKINLRVGEERP